MVLLEGKKYVEIDKVLQSAQYFSVVNASINNARERKIVTLNIIIVSRPVRTVAVIFFGCGEGNYDLLTQW